MTWVYLICLIAFIVCAIGSARAQTKLHKAQEDSKAARFDAQTNWLTQYGLSNNPTYKWENNVFVLDESQSNTYISNSILAGSSQVFLQIPFSKIIGFETLIDNQVETKTTGALSRALVGGMLAGGAGAIVGAASAKTVSTDKIQSYKAVLYLNDLSNPRLEFNLLDAPVQKTDYTYTEARKFAESVNASVKAILARNEEFRAKQSALTAQNQQPLPPKSPAALPAKKQPRVCSVCGKKPIVAAKVADGSGEMNAFLCESCLRSAAKIAHLRIVGSIDERYPAGMEIGSALSAEPSLDDFCFPEE